MYGDFKLMEGDTHIGNFIINSEEDVWSYTAVASLDRQPLIFAIQFERTGQKTFTGNAVRDWITNRAPEPNYMFIDALLEKVGIKEYDPLAFVAYNGGRFNTDKFYLVGPGMKEHEW